MIHYQKGDATDPQAKPPWILAHICNDRGGWGKGFVLAVSAKWPEVETKFRNWYRLGEDAGEDPFELGAIQMVRIGPSRHVANMLAQHGYRSGKEGIPLRYPALRQCLARLRLQAIKTGASVHMPRIGCGLGGGDWKTVSQIIDEELQGTDVWVYDP